MTKEWWIFLLRVIIFHRKSPPYKSPSERRYRAKREKTVTESRGSRYGQEVLPSRQRWS